MTDMYTAMRYFVVATLHFYRDEITPCQADEFHDLNREIWYRVFNEAKQYCNYELSRAQMESGIAAYFRPTRSEVLAKANK